MKTQRVLFLCKKRSTDYHVSTGLLNSSQFIANYLMDKGIDSKVVDCIDANSIDKEVFLYKPTHVIISAIWVTPAKLEELIHKYRNIQWQVRIHSKIPFIANEGIAFEWILNYVKIDKWKENLTISGNSPEFCHALSATLDMEELYLPNIYRPTYKPDIVHKKCDGVIDIGCFGAIRPLKNQLMQAMAAIAFGNVIDKQIRFHINVDRTEQAGEQVLKNIRALFKGSRHTLVEHPWMKHIEFLALVASMDIGMQCSITETFNIVCADFVHMRVPIVVSKEIQWMDANHSVDPMSMDAIIKELLYIYDEGRIHRAIENQIDIWKLEKYNTDAGKKWLEYINS